MPVIGWFGSDIVDAAGDALSGAYDAIVDTIPGGRAFVDGVDAIVVGPVRDFAQTGVGRAMLTALASTVTVGLQPYLGAQLATVAFALPGVAAGQDFVTAWTQEFGSRVQQTAEILGADAVPAEWGDQLKKATDFVNKYDIPWDKIDFHELAKQAGIREDVAAWLVAGATQRLDLFTGRHFDPKTGADLGPYPTAADVTRRIADAEIAAALKARALEINRETFVKVLPASMSPVQILNRCGVACGLSGAFAQRVASAPPSQLPPQPNLVRAALPAGAAADSPNRRAGDIMLGVVLVAAVGALAYHFTR